MEDILRSLPGSSLINAPSDADLTVTNEGWLVPMFIVAPIAAMPASAIAQAGPSQPRSNTTAAPGAADSASGIKVMTQAILEEIDKRSELMANIEYLCDMIGPRPTGSPNLTRANHSDTR